MANLRDRGYGNSMDGYTPKERHTRQKTVAPGEANVSKGRKVSTTPVQDSAAVRLPSPDEIRASYVPVPEYAPVYHGGNPQQSAPLNLQYTDPERERRFGDLENAYQQYAGQQKQLVPAETRSNMSMEDLKKRIDELNEAIWNIYRKRDGDTFRVFDMNHRQTGGDNPSYFHEPWENYVDAYPDYHAAATLSENNWNMHDFLDDWMPDITNDPAALALEHQAHTNAAVVGNTILEDPGDYWDSLAKNKEARIKADEKQYDRLVQEYRNLTNEYNTRLAQYLQGLR